MNHAAAQLKKRQDARLLGALALVLAPALRHRIGGALEGAQRQILLAEAGMLQRRYQRRGGATACIVPRDKEPHSVRANLEITYEPICHMDHLICIIEGYLILQVNMRQCHIS